MLSTRRRTALTSSRALTRRPSQRPWLWGGHLEHRVRPVPRLTPHPEPVRAALLKGCRGGVSQTRALLHGDDFVVAGPKKAIEIVRVKVMEWYEVKLRTALGREATIRISSCLGGWCDGPGRASSWRRTKSTGGCLGRSEESCRGPPGWSPAVRTEADDDGSDENLGRASRRGTEQ